MNVSEYLIKKLEEIGICDYFGVPGDYNFNIIYTIQNNSNLKWLGCTNELNAGYAADGYARIKGYGAVITTYGVGELSAVNAIAGCYAENIPVIHIVGMPSTKKMVEKSLIHHNLQEIDYTTFIDAYKNITAASAILDKDNAKIEIDRILKTFINRNLPVYIAIPEDIAVMDISERKVSFEQPSEKETLNIVSQKIADKISSAKQPVIIGDTLVKRFNAKIEYKEFVEKSGIPVSNFIMGMDLVDMDYPNYLGGYFSEFRNPIANKYIEETDCCIAIGTIYSDINSFGFSLPFKINEHIAIYGNHTYIEGKRYDNIKMSDVLESVTKLIEHRNFSINKPNIGLKHKEAEKEELTSFYIFSRIQEFIKDNDIVFVETGSIPLGFSQVKLKQNVDVESQLLWGSIGWATPATFGACIAKPGSKVILITGDGAHQFTAMEIGSMLRYGLKPIVIVINNKGYSVERLLSKDPQNELNEIVQMNYTKFTRTFEGDIWSTRVNTEEDFDKALRVTQIMNKMCYIEVCTKELEVPQLLKEYITKSNIQKDSITDSAENNCDKPNDIDQLILSSQNSGFEYETIVHKALKTDFQRQENSENNE